MVAETIKINADILKAPDQYNSRTYPRLSCKLNLRFNILRTDPQSPNWLISDGVEHSSITKDISAGGVCFASGYSLPVGTILNFRIHLEEKDRSIDCLAKVCRIEDDQFSAMFHLVAYYLDISSADRVRIDEFVRRELARQGNKK